MSVLNKSSGNKNKPLRYEMVTGCQFDNPLYAALQGQSPSEIFTVEQLSTHLTVNSVLQAKWEHWGYIAEGGKDINRVNASPGYYTNINIVEVYYCTIYSCTI
jgi:hypothetical protein